MVCKLLTAGLQIISDPTKLLRLVNHNAAIKTSRYGIKRLIEDIDDLFFVF